MQVGQVTFNVGIQDICCIDGGAESRLGAEMVQVAEGTTQFDARSREEVVSVQISYRHIVYIQDKLTLSDLVLGLQKDPRHQDCEPCEQCRPIPVEETATLQSC